MKKLILLFFLAVVFLFGISPNVFAVTETSGDLQVSWDDPLFSSSIVWYPGLTVAKSFTVKNIGATTHKTSLNTSNTSQTGDFAGNLFFRVDEGVANYYGGANDKTMKNFWDNGETSLSDIGPGSSAIYMITINMPVSLGNEFQAKTAKFDLIVGFVGTEAKVTISAGGGGTVGGASVQVCNDSVPGSAPSILSAASGINSVTLTWSEASDPVSYYLVAYGISPNDNIYGNPNVGGKGTTSYTVAGLSGGTTYCFIVRAGNGCMPGNFSGQICAAPGGGFVAVPAPGFATGVLGVATSEEKLTSTISPGPAIAGEVEGAANEAACSCFWWPILLGEALILFLYRRFILKKEILDRKNKKFILTISVPALSYAVFLLLNKCLKVKFLFFVQSSSIFCRYFIIFTILVYLIYLFVWKRQEKKSISNKEN